MGKTSFALNMARFAAIHKPTTVLVFTLEMSKEQMGLRLLCSEAMVDSQKLRVGNLDEFEWDKLAAAAGTLSESNVFVDETPEVTPARVKAIAQAIQAEHGLGLIVVDYLQLMRADHELINREQEIAEITRELKAMAKELTVHVLVCSQLNRGPDERWDKRPRLSDLNASGAIEEVADVVLLIYRDEVYNPDTEDRGIAEVQIAKHRNGPVSTKSGVRLAFVPQFATFANLLLR